MRLAASALLLLGGLNAQVMPTPEPVTRGVVVETDSKPSDGEFSIRLDNYEVLRYRFDNRTAVERDNYPIDVPRLRSGDMVEVQSVEIAGSPLRYAASVRSLPAAVHAVLHLPSGPRGHQTCLIPGRPETCLQPPSLLEDPIFRRGNMTFSGVIVRMSSAGLVLHTRLGERSILLRGDTRYFDNGALAQPSALQPNMRVFIRGGRNLYDEFEGYQVVWGEILEPK
jgi:hypothetical protein